MTRLWRGLSARSGDVVAALLIALLTSGWFLASRAAPDATSTASASRGQQSAMAVASRTPTPSASLSPSQSPSLSPSLSPNPDVTPGPTLGPGPTSAPGTTPSASPLPQPSASTTAGPGQSQTPPPGKTATPTATPGVKPTPTPGALPDLLAIDYGLGDDRAVCGGENTSYVTVQNSGKAAAPAGTAVLFQFVEGKAATWEETQTIPTAIEPGGSYTLKAVFELADPCPIDMSLTWSIDPANAILESKEDNNSAAAGIKSASG
jgi:hypothetical protein